MDACTNADVGPAQEQLRSGPGSRDREATVALLKTAVTLRIVWLCLLGIARRCASSR